MSSTIAKKYKFLYYIIGLILIVAILQICSLCVGDSLLFPSVFDIIKRACMLIVSPTTYLYIGNTLLQLLISLFFAFIIGISLGVLAAINERIEYILKPIMAFFRCVPIIVIMLVCMVAISFYSAPIFACVLFIFPGIYENTKEGVKAIDKTLLDVYKMESNFSIRGLCKVHIPMIASYTKAAFINYIGVGLKVLITTEYIAGVKDTIGKALLEAPQSLDYEIIYAYTLILLLVISIIELIPFAVQYFVNLRNNRKNTEK